MNPKHNRAERRLFKNLQNEKIFHGLTPEDTVPQIRFLPFVGIIMGFVFISAVFSLVVGAHMWVGHNVWPRIVGWSFTIMIGVTTFMYWTRIRNFFKFSKRWFILMPLAFMGGVLTALLFVYLIGSWQEFTQLKYRENQNKDLIDVASHWKTGETWNENQCKVVEKQQKNFVNQLNNTSQPPYIGEILILFSTMDVSYQAGCDPQWRYAIDILTAPKLQWKHSSSKSIQGFNDFIRAQYPNSKKGCRMERARLNPETQKPLYSALDFLCTEMPSQSSWTPGVLTAQAQILLQQVKRNKN